MFESEKPRVGTCSFDLELRYVAISPWLAYLHGLSISEHLGHTIRELLPEMADMVEVQLENVIETGTPLLKGQAYAETPALPDLKRLWQHDYVPIRDDDGKKVVGVICAVRDITRRWLHTEIPRIMNDIRRLEAWELSGPAPEEEEGSPRTSGSSEEKLKQVRTRKEVAP